MSWIEENLLPSERIVYKAHVHRVAYVWPVLLLASMTSFGRFSGMVTTELALTDKRVIGKMGTVHKKRLDLPHKSIASVKAQQGLFGQIFGYGNIMITGNDDSKIKFRGIADPVDMQIQIEEAVEIAVLGRKLSQTVMDKF